MIFQNVDFSPRFNKMQSAVWFFYKAFPLPPPVFPNSSNWIREIFIRFQSWEFGVGTSIGPSSVFSLITWFLVFNPSVETFRPSPLTLNHSVHPISGLFWGRQLPPLLRRRLPPCLYGNMDPPPTPSHLLLPSFLVKPNREPGGRVCLSPMNDHSFWFRYQFFDDSFPSGPWEWFLKFYKPWFYKTKIAFQRQIEFPTMEKVSHCISVSLGVGRVNESSPRFLGSLYLSKSSSLQQFIIMYSLSLNAK